MTTEKDKEDYDKKPYEYPDDYIGWDIWTRGPLYPDPDWFPSSSNEVNVAWEYFARMDNGESAMEAIEAILKEKLTLPNDLVPWVIKACVAWREATGNKQELRTMKTQRELWNVFHAIYTLRMKGLTQKKATKKIAKQTGRAWEVLMETRKYPIFKEVKKNIHLRLRLLYVILRNEGRDVEADLMMETYPNYFKNGFMTRIFPAVRDLLVNTNHPSD